MWNLKLVCRGPGVEKSGQDEGNPQVGLVFPTDSYDCSHGQNHTNKLFNFPGSLRSALPYAR